MDQQFVSTHQVESGFQGNHKRYPTQFSGHLTSDLDQHLAELDGTTYKVWSCLNRLLDSRAVNCQGYYLGYTVRVSQENLAERVGMSVRSVRRHLSKLEASGIIQVERPVFGCNRYRLMGYVDAIEKQIDPATPSLETVDRFIEQDALSPDPVADTKAEDTAVLSRGQGCVPSRGQDGVLHNRPILIDKSIIT